MGDVLEIAVIGATLVMGMILMVPITWIWTNHRRKIEEMRLRHKVAISDETRVAIESVRKEMAALRDTTSEYDVSFDTALHRIESRMGNVEHRLLQVERSQEAGRLGGIEQRLQSVEEQPNTYQVGR